MKCTENAPQTFSPFSEWKHSQESPGFHIICTEFSCQGLGVHLGLGLCLAMISRERGEPREADEKGWRRGRQIFLMLFFKKQNKTHNKTAVEGMTQ